MRSKLRLSKLVGLSACLPWVVLTANPAQAFPASVNTKLSFQAESSFTNTEAAAQSVSGTVTDQAGAPLPGATVVVKGTTKGTSTNAEGKFVIDADADAVLVVSFVGYATKQIPVNGQSSITIQLGQDLSQLNEVVVVGYGTQKRSDITGAISSISSESFNRGVVTNPGELLQGKLAGVSIAANSGEPGAAQDIIIRGIGSLRSGTQPLYVVDGFLLDNSNTGVPTNPLTFINPNDIESIDVLKDASATAVYGSRASNGVVVITTKKGKGKPQMTLAASTAISSMAKKIDVFDADAFRREVVATGGTLQDFGANTNWQDELSQTGVSNTVNLSMSGANSESFSYFTSVGYQDQEGILKNSRLKRYSGKLNLNQKAFNGRMKVDYNLTASRTENLRPDITSTMSDMLTLNPTIPPYTNGVPTLLNTNALNPLARYNLFSDKAINHRILANISPSIEILDGLVYKLNFGVDYSTTTRNQQYKPFPAVVNESDVSNGVLDNAISGNTNQLVENTLTYNWFRKDHSVTLLAGHSYQKFLDETRITTYRGFANNNIDPIYQDHTSTTALPTAVNSEALKNELQSFFGRVNYIFADKYMFTGTFRADGSSKFGQNNKYGYFPSFAAGWNISKEAFMNNTVFNNLKLRASWGQTGNQEIPSKITKASYLEQRLQTGTGSVSTYPIDTDATSLQGYPYGIIFTRLANPNLKWEVSTQADLGIDFAFFKSRLTGTLDYFNKQSSNILLEVVPSDPVQPTSTYWTNIPNMKIQNNGVELTLNYGSDPSRDFSYNIGGNFTYIQNKVKKSPYAVLATGAAQGSGQSGATINGYINGQPLGAFYMYEFDGINPDNGQNVFRDTNGDGAILDNDRVVVGSAIPKIIYGYNLNFKYKAFDLGLNFNGVAGNKIFNHTTMTLFSKAQLAKSNNTTDFAIKYPNEALSNANVVSTRYLENGSFMRLNNATLAYNLNFAGSKLGNVIQRASLTLTGQNLFVISSYSGFDPEVNTGSAAGGIQTFGIDRFTYPRARTFLLGLNVTF
ncbi:SusC/RagA family TonB-linked outer membrane protein [Dyadobacter endophyticus]|uniref:SusC/RagA family TonB-linked outer membrane protein n=1 Tax=Dyadobacter endophyticus TaxID=1749036 RepID=UPI00166960C0|nr:TonB-dependent receptor [Dyadobacter endophyticus]